MIELSLFSMKAKKQMTLDVVFDKIRGKYINDAIKKADNGIL